MYGLPPKPTRFPTRHRTRDGATRRIGSNIHGRSSAWPEHWSPKPGAVGSNPTVRAIYSSVAQWQSAALLMRWSLVRIQPGELHFFFSSFFWFMSLSSTPAEFFAEDKDEKIDRLEKRIDKLENTVERLFQIIDAQIYPDEKPEDVS